MTTPQRVHAAAEHYSVADLGGPPANPSASWVAADLTADELQALATLLTGLARLLPDETPFAWGTLRGWTPFLDVPDRRSVFALLPDELRISAWQEARQDRRELVMPEDTRATVKPLRDVSRPRQDRGDLAPVLDALRAIPATEYVAILARVDVPTGGMVRCPLPGHEDRTPSFHADAGDRGWYCHGCGKGGGVIDLAGHLWNRPTSGSTFPDLVREIHGALLSAGRAAA